MDRLVTAIVLAGLLPTATAAALPPGDPPNITPPGGFAPPAAWIETPHGDRWLYPRDWLWCSAGTGATCTGEPVAALSPAGWCQLQVFGYQEEATVRPGETVRFHLEFAPETATLAFGGLVEPLTAAQDISWIVSGSSGGLILRTRVGLSRVDYRVRLVVGNDLTAPAIKTLRVTREGNRVFLRVRASEPVAGTGCITSARPLSTQTRRLLSTAGRLRLPPARITRGVRLIPIGRLPNGVFDIRFRLRDMTGNTTLLDEQVRVTPEGVSLLR